MSFEKFFDWVDASPFGVAVHARKELLEHTDPDRIYVENIRSFFRLPFSTAKFLCDTAVRAGFFERCIGLECPNEACRRLIVAECSDAPLPASVTCEVCEGLERERFEFTKEECHAVVFYRLSRPRAEASSP
jgi:hypothetical protein